MKPVKRVAGNAIPLNRSNVDTDQIMPKQYLKRVERTGYGPFTFDEWRKDPDFVLNNPAYRDAPILITQRNFGSGSSREHAVWAIEGLGVEALIAPSFADIFKNNCMKVGLLTVELPEEDVDYLLARSEELPESQIEVDLESQTVRTNDGAWERHFDVSPFTRWRLMNGFDDIGMTLAYEPDIAAFEEARSDLLPLTSAAE